MQSAKRAACIGQKLFVVGGLRLSQQRGGGRFVYGTVMDKSEFYNELIETLRGEFTIAVNASRDAAAYATNEESRANSKYDTQGLEASYLAAGQASQARRWAEMVERLQSERNALLQPRQKVVLGALFYCSLAATVEWFFFSPVAGGQVIRMGELDVTVITPDSPLATRLRGLALGDSVVLPNGQLVRILWLE